MRFRPTYLLSLLAFLLAGCINSTEKQPVVTAERPPPSSLSIYDEAQNLLTQEPIPSRGWRPLNVVIREGRHEDTAGIFIKFNSNVRFVPWTDLSADPRGLQVFSDSFAQVGELTLRVTKAPCGGRLPLVFQLSELRLPARQDESLKPETVVYQPLADWSETGLYLPEDLIERIDEQWPDEPCQPTLSPEDARDKWKILAPNFVRISIEPRDKETKAPSNDGQPGHRPCRSCRDSDDNGSSHHHSGQYDEDWR